MPTSISRGGATATTYSYDGNGKRVKKTTPGFPFTSTTYYVGEHFEAFDMGAAIRYVFAGSLRIAREYDNGGLLLYYHKDHLGSSTVMTNSSGVGAYGTSNYEPFGGMRSTTGQSGSSYKFTDQELDSESGLYNYNARLYDPEIGRFISADPIVPDPFNPQSLNRYSYVLNNPLIYTDPSGYQQSAPGQDEEKYYPTFRLDEIIIRSPDMNIIYRILRSANYGRELFERLNQTNQRSIKAPVTNFSPAIEYEHTVKRELSNAHTKEVVAELGEALGAHRYVVSGSDRTRAEHQVLRDIGATGATYEETKHGSIQGYKAADVKYLYRSGKQIPPLDVANAARKLRSIGGVIVYNTRTHIDTRLRRSDGTVAYFSNRTGR